MSYSRNRDDGPAPPSGERKPASRDEMEKLREKLRAYEPSFGRSKTQTNKRL